MKRKQFVLLLVLFVLLGGGAVYRRLTASPPMPPEEASSTDPPIAVGNSESGEGDARRLLLGVWHDEYKGKRTINMNADGTGTMLVELSGASAFLFAPKLHFNMKWSLNDKTLTTKTLGGEPADKVNMILNTMGDNADYTVLEVAADRLLLLDKDGETKYDWRRAKEDAVHRK